MIFVLVTHFCDQATASDYSENQMSIFAIRIKKKTAVQLWVMASKGLAATLGGKSNVNICYKDIEENRAWQQFWIISEGLAARDWEGGIQQWKSKSNVNIGYKRYKRKQHLNCDN